MSQRVNLNKVKARCRQQFQPLLLALVAVLIKGSTLEERWVPRSLETYVSNRVSQTLKVEEGRKTFSFVAVRCVSETLMLFRHVETRHCLNPEIMSRLD